MTPRSWPSCLVALALLLPGAGCGEAEEPAGAPADYAPLERQLACVEDHTRALLQGDRLRRADGYAYTVDLAQLLIFAARRADAATYDTLRQRLLATVYLSGDSDLKERGFVAWRHHKDLPLDATGTTEALRLAQGLWEGAGLGNAAADDDRSLALTIAAGYARHQGVDQGIWMIRNYYNLWSKAFATNSFLVDYDPDLLVALVARSGDTNLGQVADRSYDVVLRAVSPAGLIHAVIQPELATLTDRGLAFFSPNDVIKLANTCTVAERAVMEARGVAEGVLRFAVEHQANLREFYLGATGAAAPGAGPAGTAARACLARLAVRLASRAALDRLWPGFTAGAPDACSDDGRARLDPYLTSEVGLTLDAVHGFLR